MEIVLYIFEGLVPIVLIVWFINYYMEGREEKYFKKIDFSHKDDYVCLYFLSGDILCNPGHCVISKSYGGFYLEIEDSSGDVRGYKIDFDNFLSIDIEPVDCVMNKREYKVYDPTDSKSYKKHNINVRKGYRIKIATKDGKNLYLLSKKNVKSFFNF